MLFLIGRVPSRLAFQRPEFVLSIKTPFASGNTTALRSKSTKMSDVTSLVPAPEGVVPNFDNPQQQGDTAAYICFGVGIPLSLLFTAQRIYVKKIIQAPWQIDDCESFLVWNDTVFV